MLEKDFFGIRFIIIKTYFRGLGVGFGDFVLRCYDTLLNFRDLRLVIDYVRFMFFIEGSYYRLSRKVVFVILEGSRFYSYCVSFCGFYFFLLKMVWGSLGFLKTCV